MMGWLIFTGAPSPVSLWFAIRWPIFAKICNIICISVADLSFKHMIGFKIMFLGVVYDCPSKKRPC